MGMSVIEQERLKMPSKYFIELQWAIGDEASKNRNIDV